MREGGGHRTNTRSLFFKGGKAKLTIEIDQYRGDHWFFEGSLYNEKKRADKNGKPVREGGAKPIRDL